MVKILMEIKECHVNVHIGHLGLVLVGSTSSPPKATLLRHLAETEEEELHFTNG
jgi:hypothetical protein